MILDDEAFIKEEEQELIKAPEPLSFEARQRRLQIILFIEVMDICIGVMGAIEIISLFYFS